ncbi:flippase [candidate division KSB1 bacterium]|nr:flippase [candidate division KSB1 bacterium]
MKKYWLKSGAFSFLGNGVTLAFAFFTFMVLVRILSQQEFGVWVLYLTVTTFAEILRNGITQNAILKFLEGGKAADYSKIVTASLFINVMTGLLGYVVIVLLSSILSQVWKVPDLQAVLLLYGLYILFYMPLTFIQFVCMANLEFKARFFTTLTYNTLNFLIVVGWCKFRGTVQLIELPVIQSISAAIALIQLIITSGKYIRLAWPIDWKWVSTLFHFGKYVFATAFSSMLFNRMDLMMVGYFINPTAVAIYNIPMRLGNYVEVPMNTMVSIVFPKAAERMKEEGIHTVRYLYERSVGTMLAIIVPCAIILGVFARPIVLLVAGEQYLDAVPIMQVLAFVSVLKPFSRQGGTILDCIGYPNYNFYSLFLSLIINFGLNWLFIVKMGIIGAIYATLLSVAIGTFIQQILLVKLINITPSHPIHYMWAFYRDSFRKIKSLLKPAHAHQ